MALTTGSVTTAVNAVTATATHASIHTADPGTTGTSEATGGSPAYARLALTWTSGTSAQVTFNLPAGTYTHFGLWNAVTAGTFVGGAPLSVSTTLSGQGQIKLTVNIVGTAS